MMHTNSPASIESQSPRRRSISPPDGAGKALWQWPSMEMNLSVIATSLIPVGDDALQAGQDLVEHHADQADQQDRVDHVGDREVVPLVPDEVADAGTADEHFGRHDDEPGDADRDAHARQDGRRGGGQDHREGRPTVPSSSVLGDVDPVLAHRRDAERRVEQHRPHRADEDHEDRAKPGILDRVERQRHPGERRDRLHDLDERIERPVHQRRHADQEAERHGDDHGEKIARPTRAIE